MKKTVPAFSFQSIGTVRSPFKGKFGVPRQPGLAAAAAGQIHLNNTPDLKTALKSLDEFSHLWIIFVFHAHGAKNWKPSVRPPRLGGNRKVGVLASRSPHRPNPIGLSVVTIESIEFDAPQGPIIHVRGLDLLDGTPVLDIKPYVPYADAIPNAGAGWAGEAMIRTPVQFKPEAEERLGHLDPTRARGLRKMIVEVLELDPRPAYQQRKLPLSTETTWGTRYGFEILGHDVKYEIRADGFWVYDIL